MIMESSTTTSYRNPSPPPSPTSSELRDNPYPLDSSGVPTAAASAAQRSEEGDRIGGTVFSKAWVLSILVRSLQCVSAQNEDPSEGACDSNMQGVEFVVGSKVGDSGANERNSPLVGDDDCHRNGGACSADNTGSAHEGREGGDDGEMDPSLEEELCLLWDTSMNTVSAHNHIVVRLPHYLGVQL